MRNYQNTIMKSEACYQNYSLFLEHQWKHKGKDISQILAVVSQLPSSFVWQLLKFLFWMKILQD